MGVTGRTWWTRVRILGGTAVLVLLALQLGTEPFRDALRAVDLPLVVAGLGVTAFTTVCCAQRWRLLARDGDRHTSMPVAVGAYYRAQFLNVTLPGGVAGDAHRAWRHGLHGVFWDRALGQVVQVALAVAVLVLVPSPYRSVALALGAGAALAAVVLLLRRLAPRAWPRVAGLSAAAVVGHVGLFLLAARAAGVPAGPATLLPLSLLVLLGSAIPLSIAGWGPREGTAAWAFGAFGVGAAEGLTTAVLYGAVVLLATAPGAVLLLADARRR